MILAGKKETFADVGGKKETTFSLAKIEGFGDSVDGGGGLFHKQLNGGVGNNGFALIEA